MTDIMAVLNALTEPAFFCKDGRITRCNLACARLPLCVGDQVPLDLPATDGKTHTAASFCGSQWEITALSAEDELLVLLRACGDVPETLNLLDAAARGFRQPMTAVANAGSSLFAQIEELEDEHLQTEAAALSRGIFRTLRNLSAMTEYSRLLRCEDALFVEKNHVKAFFEELVELWSDMLLDGGFRLEYHAPQKEFNANFDRALVQRAVLALLSNAAAWSEDEAPIALAVSYQGSKMKITVKNTGCPMEPDVFATAFSRFEHVSPLDDARWGAGFGLPLARLIAQKHGGSIFLESNEGGTTVTMFLDVNTPLSTGLHTPTADPASCYDPAVVEFSGILPDETYDSRNIEL